MFDTISYNRILLWCRLGFPQLTLTIYPVGTIKPLQPSQHFAPAAQAIIHITAHPASTCLNAISVIHITANLDGDLREQNLRDRF